jgi:hypothetical protein
VAVVEMISEVISIRIWTSIASLSLVLAFLVSPVSAQILDDSSGYGGGYRDSGFQVPQFDSSQELVFELFVPFLVLFLLNRLALQQALKIPLGDPSDIDGPDESKINRYATLISLTIVSSLIPTQLWSWVRGISNIIGLTPLVIVLGVVLLLGYRVFR